MPTLLRSNSPHPPGSPSHPTSSPPRGEARYFVPGDEIRLVTNDPGIHTLADRLWDRAPAARVAGHLPALITLTIDVRPADDASPIAGTQDERWVWGADDAELWLGDQLHARIACTRGTMDGRASTELVAHQPALIARLLLETPMAMVLARRGYGLLHAGAVTGPGGAVVIRGRPGAGKSTLVAAAYRSGLDVLGDETILVARSDPDDLLAAVRDVTVLPDATRLLGLEHAVTAIRSGGEDKHRLDLFASSTPAARRARRVATVLLGSRGGDQARLEPLTPETFLREFADGGIVQERWSGTPEHIADAWSRSGAYRLSGGADLAGAVQHLTHLVTLPAAVSRA